MSRADNLLVLCLAFISGVFTASFLMPKFFSVSELIIAAILALALIGLFWQKPVFVLSGFCLLLFIFGAYLFNIKYLSIVNNVFIANDQHDAALYGKIIREPQLSYKNQRLIVSVKKIVLDSGRELSGAELGKIIIYADNFEKYSYADQIKAIGKINIPKNLNGFDYQGYLAKDGIVASLNYPKIEVLNNSPKLNVFELIYLNILKFKDLMRQQIEKDLSPREGAVVQAMILGDSVMPDELKQKLSQSGLSHAIAISGAHIVLFSVIIFETLLFFGLWKKQASIVSIVLIGLYVILVGAMASAVRSGIMACLLMLAQLFDRQGESERVLVLAAFLILLQNPLALKYDLGFELSFLAIMGLIFVAPSISNWFAKIFKNRFKSLNEILSATLAAQSLTLPILVFNFGYFSTISILSNILTSPIMPVLMALGIGFPLIGMIIPFFGFGISFFCSLLTKYLLFIVDLSAQAPFAIFSFKISALAVFAVYAAIFIFALKQRRKNNFTFLAQ
jgi:competence protein ComEC